MTTCRKKNSKVRLRGGRRCRWNVIRQEGKKSFNLTRDIDKKREEKGKEEEAKCHTQDEGKLFHFFPNDKSRKGVKSLDSNVKGTALKIEMKHSNPIDFKKLNNSCQDAEHRR